MSAVWSSASEFDRLIGCRPFGLLLGPSSGPDKNNTHSLANIGTRLDLARFVEAPWTPLPTTSYSLAAEAQVCALPLP